MNWINFQDENYRLTEQEVNSLSKDILDQYRLALADIKEQVKTAYAEILSGVAAEDYYNAMLKYDRLTLLEKNITEAYRAYSLRAQTLTEHAVSVAASNSFYRSMYAQSWLVENMPKVVLPYDIVELVVYGTASEWKAIPEKRRLAYEAKYGKLGDLMPQSGTLSEAIIKNRTKEIAEIQQALTQGLRSGKSYTQMANGISDIIGSIVKGEGGEITASGAFANAARIAATESTRAMNATSFAATQYMSNNGVDIKKRWVATLDSHTRSSHRALDGKTIGVDEYFRIGSDSALYPGGFSEVGNNARCRCTTIDIINGQGPALRTGRNPVTGEHEVFDYKNFDDWAKEKGLKKNIYGEIYA